VNGGAARRSERQEVPVSLQATNLSGEPTLLPEDELEALRLACLGEVLVPGDLDYNDARLCHNARFDYRPALLLRAAGAADVLDAVALARRRGLLVAVRSGGHSVAGHCSADGALMIDMSGMDGVWVEPDSGRVRVQGGATWAAVDRETQAYGLAVPGGTVSTIGVGGLTLGGGIGWLHRKHGLAADNLIEAEVVTADGSSVRAGRTDDADLWWGLRGGGGNFGVATSFVLQAHPVGPMVMTAWLAYAAEDAADALRAWRDWTLTVPDEVTSRAAYRTLPAAPQYPPAVHHRAVLVTESVYAGPVDEGEKVLQPVRELGAPVADLSGPRSYRTLQRESDAFFPKGQLVCVWKSTYLDAFEDDMVDLVVRLGADRPDPLTLVHVSMVGGAVRRVAPADTGFLHRDAAYLLSVDGTWLDAADTQANSLWVRSGIEAARRLPAAHGPYLNFAGDRQVDTRELQAAYGANLPRLQALKKQYDPGNLFRLNPNIPPSP
jgi:FAD/FMN-containing dehydrogenase